MCCSRAPPLPRNRRSLLRLATRPESHGASLLASVKRRNTHVALELGLPSTHVSETSEEGGSPKDAARLKLGHLPPTRSQLVPDRVFAA